jgi:hypothetical protein
MLPCCRGPKVEPPAPIDYAAPRRRRSEDIQRELDRNAERTAAYRPPNIKAVATDAEKARLAEKFSYGGGKALPTELTAPVQPIPSEVLAKRKEADRIAKVMRRRSGLPEVSLLSTIFPRYES